MESAWYVLRTKPHQEPLVERRLGELQVESYLPRIAASVRAGRHLQRRVMPMFPTYLFVRADLEQRERALRYTPGVRDFLRCGGAAQCVPPEIVEVLRDRTGPTGVYAPPPQRFEPGERLRIEDGPLRGIEVIFERELSGADRVAVLLSEIELKARIVLPRGLLSAA